MSDNGTAFTSQEFQTFCKINSIKRICSAPYHPASNGLAERVVQTLKAELKKTPGPDLETRMYHFLSRYRVTSRTTNFAGIPKWLPRLLQTKLGPVSFTVELTDGRVWRRNIDYIPLRIPEESGGDAGMSPPVSTVVCAFMKEEQERLGHIPNSVRSSVTMADFPVGMTGPTEAAGRDVAPTEVEQTNDVRWPTEVADTVITESGDLRRSTRVHKPLVKLNL